MGILLMVGAGVLFLGFCVLILGITTEWDWKTIIWVLSVKAAFIVVSVIVSAIFVLGVYLTYYG